MSFLLRLIEALLGIFGRASRKPADASSPTPATPPAPPTSKPAPASPPPDPAVVAAATLVVEFEGFVPHPYQDPVGIWTIGYGSTRDKSGVPVTAATPPITQAAAKALVERDLRVSFEEITRDVQVPLSDNQRAALADFIYNLGSGNFRSSTLLRKLNAGDDAGAAAEFDKWDHAGGKELAGLLRRREAETKLFTS